MPLLLIIWRVALIVVKIKTKIILTFSILMLVMVISVSFFVSSKSQEMILEEENRVLYATAKAIKKSMEERLALSEVGVYSLSENPDIQKAFAERDRERLLEMLLPVYENLKETISQIQFHLPDSTSFLRLHQPTKYGDSLKDFRFTVKDANENKKTIKGLENGVAGIGFRVVVPMTYNGEHIGTLEYGSDFTENFINAIKNNFGGDYIVYKFSENNSQLLFGTIEDKWGIGEDVNIEKLKRNEEVFFLEDDKHTHITLIPFTDYSDEVIGYFKIVNDRTETLKKIQDVTIKTISIICVIYILLVLILYYLIDRILNPVKKLINITQKVSDGDLINMVEVNSKDEISLLGSNFNKMIESLRSIISQSYNAAEQVASTSEEFSSASEEITASSEQISSTLIEISGFANRQAESIKESKESMEKLLNSINGAVENISQISTSANLTVDVANRGMDLSKNAVNKIIELQSFIEYTLKEIYKLNDSSKEIEKIVLTISNIASKTNLLALNASIEAARAGEYGKGFSVVADEIKKLSDQTTMFLSQIEDIIKNVQHEMKIVVGLMQKNNQEVDISVNIVEETNSGFEEILEEINKVAIEIDNLIYLMENVKGNSIDISNNINIVNDLAYNTERLSKDVVIGAEQQTSAMEEVASASMNLAELAIRLRDSIAKFKTE